jgi:hypothetical protein
MSRWHSVMWRSRIATAEQCRHVNRVLSVVPSGAAIGLPLQKQHAISTIGDNRCLRAISKAARTKNYSLKHRTTPWTALPEALSNVTSDRGASCGSQPIATSICAQSVTLTVLSGTAPQNRPVTGLVCDEGAGDTGNRAGQSSASRFIFRR